MKLTLQQFEDPAAFKAAVFPLLLENEALYCVGLGAIDILINEPKRYPAYTLAGLFLDGNVVGAAWILPPHPLGITAMPEGAIPELIKFALTQKMPPPGVVGPPSVVELFLSPWLIAAKCGLKSRMAQRIFELSRVNPFPASAGAMRVAGERDLGLLEQWNVEFSRDVGLGDDPILARDNAIHAIKNRSRFFWEVDGEVVAMTGLGGKTPSGIRITSVFTPPRRRGRGYASSLVARLSERQLHEGRRFCFLYADVANPVANRIYQKIGYKAVSDSTYLAFQY